MIDGRNEEVPSGTVYQIRFWYGRHRRRMEWGEVSPDLASLAVKYEHRYQIAGSFNSWRKDDLKRDRDEDGIWEYDVKVGVTGAEEFKLFRDYDDQQSIYPAKPRCTKTSVPVR